METIVVGAGQAGIATSHELAARGVDHLVLEAGRIGQTWRTRRWDSFRLVTPNWMNVLPGQAPTGPAEGYSTADAFVAGLSDHAARRGLPVVENTTVVTACRTGDGFTVRTADASYTARTLVVASGFQWQPRVPAARLPPGIASVHSSAYRNPENLDEYIASGGFMALRHAFEMGPAWVVREVIESKLVGRGGAAFPCGQKWQSILSTTLPRYLICNADESEPGTFKDRVLMEGDPFALIESMIIAGFATGCEQGYLYVRGEYPLARRRLEHAIRQCRAQSLLGSNILGAGVRFDVELRIGAGAYICGEETALMNSIEGKRGEPRNKPPFPTQVGLFGRPTIIQNVETLLNVLPIITRGGKSFAATGTERSTGTKLFCLSGHVATPGVFEVPFGATLRELLVLAGGIAGSGKLQAALIGGAAGAFLGPEDLDTAMTFEGTRAAGAALGSAVVMAFDDTVDLREILLRIASFFRDESCGQCVPCRVGTVRQEELLRRLADGKPLESRATELVLLKEVGQAMRDASICGLGQTASSAIESALARFPLFPGDGFQAESGGPER